MSFLSSFSKSIQSGLEEAQKSLNDLTPIAKRTARLVQEKFGTIEDISELPEEYTLLEKKVDTLRSVYNRLLTITGTYEIESYDYPPNIKESVNDISKSLTEKFQSLQKASNASEVEKILNEPNTDVKYPKTLAHELSKSAKESHDSLVAIGSNNGLSKILLKFSESEYKIGNKRIEQDQLIINEFNNKLDEILQNSFNETHTYRKDVENARLSFDTLRYELKVAPERQAELQEQLDSAEDELVNATAKAVKSMKKLIEPAEAAHLIVLFSKIQLDYHKSAVSELESLIKNLEAVPLEEEEEEDEDEDEEEEEEAAAPKEEASKEGKPRDDKSKGEESEEASNSK